VGAPAAPASAGAPPAPAPAPASAPAAPATARTPAPGAVALAPAAPVAGTAVGAPAAPATALTAMVPAAGGVVGALEPSAVGLAPAGCSFAPKAAPPATAGDAGAPPIAAGSNSAAPPDTGSESSWHEIVRNDRASVATTTPDCLAHMGCSKLMMIKPFVRGRKRANDRTSSNSCASPRTAHRRGAAFEQLVTVDLRGQATLGAKQLSASAGARLPAPCPQDSLVRGGSFVPSQKLTPNQTPALLRVRHLR